MGGDKQSKRQIERIRIGLTATRTCVTAYQQPDETLVLRSVSCELPLAEIYERVSFPAAGSAA